MRRGKDNLVVSEGPEGSGKSTTTGNIIMSLDRDFDVQRDTIMTLDHLLEVLDDGEKGRVYDLDEAINIFHNQDWATWESKSLSKIIRQMRIMRCTWFLNAPDFEGLHPYIRDYRTRIRLYHEPVFDEYGMGNGPSKVLWKQERFDYREQRVTTRWQHIFDLEVTSLDDEPSWKPYEEKKEQNFKRMVRDMRTRRDSETRNGKGGRKQVESRVSSPTTT